MFLSPSSTPGCIAHATKDVLSSPAAEHGGTALRVPFVAKALLSLVVALGLLAASVLPATTAFAATGTVITGVTVVDWQGGPFIGSPAFLVDGSGLSQRDLGGLHAPADASNSVRKNPLEHSGDPHENLDGIFALHGAYTIASVGVWQYNSSDPAIAAGVRSVTFKTSMDGVNFESVSGGGGYVELEPGVPRTFGAPRVVFFSAPARYVMVEMTLFPGTPWGLSEVMFVGTPMAVPEPASFGLMGAGLMLLVGRRRRAYQTAASCTARGPNA